MSRTARTIQVPFRVIHCDDNGFTFIDHTHVSGGTYARTATAGARRLRSVIQEQIDVALSDARAERWIIGAQNGTVLVIEQRHGTYQYTISGPNRQHASSAMGPDSFEETRDRARRHAEQCYGGVAWEHAL